MARKRKHNRGKARRRRNWGGYSFANPRKSKRRRRNWGGYSFANPRKRKHHRRANPKRRHHRRRNPGMLGNFMAHLKGAAPGGVAAGLLDTVVGDRISGLVPGGVIAEGAAKIVIGAGLAAVGDRFLPSMSKHMLPLAAGFAAIGSKKIFGSLMGTPLGMLEELADAYGDALSELVSQSGGMRQDMGELVSGAGGGLRQDMGDLSLVDIVTRRTPEEIVTEGH